MLRMSPCFSRVQVMNDDGLRGNRLAIALEEVPEQSDLPNLSYNVRRFLFFSWNRVDIASSHFL
jgi:hypothetical protein